MKTYNLIKDLKKNKIKENILIQKDKDFKLLNKKRKKINGEYDINLNHKYKKFKRIKNNKKIKSLDKKYHSKFLKINKKENVLERINCKNKLSSTNPKDIEFFKDIIKDSYSYKSFLNNTLYVLYSVNDILT